MSFLEPIGQLLQYIWDFIPKPYLIPYTHGGLKFVRGKVPKVCKPGFYVYWPLTTTMWSAPIVRQAIIIESRPLVTKDKVSLSVSAIVVYEISDIFKFGARVYDGDETIGEVAQAAIPQIVTSHTFDDLNESLQGSAGIRLEDAADAEGVDAQPGARVLGNKYLTKSMRTFLRPFGVRVLYSAFIGLVPSQMICITGSGNNGVVPII